MAHEDAYDVRKEHKLLNSDRLAVAIADYLVENASIASVEEIDDTPITDEIRVALMGDDYPAWVAEELNSTIGEHTRPMGPVYYALDNGNAHLSLCTAQVRRKLKTEDGGSVVVNKMSRFVSDDADVVARYRLAPKFRQLERTMERIHTMVTEDVARIPALSAKVPGMIEGAHRTMQAELPAGQEE